MPHSLRIIILGKGGVSTEKRLEFILNIVYTILVILLCLFVLKYILPAFLPFLLGAFVAVLINPIVKKFSKKFDMKQKPLGVFLLILFYATVGTVVTVLTVRLIVGAGEFMSKLPTIYSKNIEPIITAMLEFVNDAAEFIYRVFGKSDNVTYSEVENLLAALRSSLGDAVSGLSLKALTALSAFAAAVPSFAVSVLFTLVSSFFFVSDMDNIVKFMKNKLPDRFVNLLSKLKQSSLNAMLNYVRSYALILFITFAELLLGFVILGIKSPLLKALCISLFDILPILGSGGILVPWGIIKLFGNCYKDGVGLILLWAVISVVRNIIEPKIVGKQVGLHPLLTLMSMYVGTKLFGFWGLILLPVMLSVYVTYKGEEL